MNSSKKQYEIKRFLSQNNVGLFGLLETKIKASNWNKVRSSLCDDWSIVTNTSLHKGGRVWLIWDPSMFQLNIIDITAQCIHAEAYDKVRKKMFWITMIYGFNKPVERESLWLSLKGYYQSINGAWITCGDFNSVMAIDERIGGAPVSLADIKPLQQVVQDCLFDHCPCLISFEEVVVTRKPAFKYFNMWSKAHNFAEMVASNWEPKVHGTLMFQVVTKLKRLKGGLKALNKDQFSDIEKLTHATELALLHFQTLLREDPLNDGLCKAEKACAQEVIWMHKVRDDYLQQKAKIQWVLDGDDNTAYFHASIRKRRSRNKVYQVRDMNDKLCSKYDEIRNAFEEYYVSLLGTSKQVTKVNKRVVQAGNCLNSQHCNLLMSHITSEEIKRAMFSIPGTKAPGPDGYSSQFFKDCWHIVGQEVCNAIKNVFHTGQLLKQCNNTVITLVPKVDLPDNVKQFRPIACCNTIYKCLSKVLCTRLSKVLPDIICQSQSAFIQGRDIVGNILICQDLIRLYNRKTCSPRMLMKLDLQKAYDSIEWSFVEEMLKYLGFPELWIKLLMQCISTPSYSIALNGETFGFFKASGLVLNTRKSNFYCNGMEDWLITEIARATGMKKGSAPFKYLGVTVAPKRLSVLNCSCLVDKVVERIKGLGARQLSYAGRLVLVKAIEHKADHLWVKWVHAVYIKDKQWIDYEPTNNSSWAWRKICQIKTIFKEMLRQSSGQYSIRDGYVWLRPNGDKSDWYQWAKNSWVTPKHGFICWVAGYGKLLTQDRLMRMYIATANTCYLCAEQTESHAHLFFECEYSRKCCQLVTAWCQEVLPEKDCILWWCRKRYRSLCRKKVMGCVIAGLMYHIWHARNVARVDCLMTRPEQLMRVLQNDVRFRIRKYMEICKDSTTKTWMSNL
ncbi:uncharacterized protein LOC141641438 [Silene latifolia]|uniref:uncharacterized protein LOC141641438 n=1 Tax=Silene latifolia TaxID=37657 RepID=UPI003D77CA31